MLWCDTEELPKPCTIVESKLSHKGIIQSGFPFAAANLQSMLSVASLNMYSSHEIGFASTPVLAIRISKMPYRSLARSTADDVGDMSTD